MSPEDQELFNFDLHQLHLQGYYEGYCRGIKQFILKDDMSKMPQARKQIARSVYHGTERHVHTYIFLLLQTKKFHSMETLSQVILVIY